MALSAIGAARQAMLRIVLASIRRGLEAKNGQKMTKMAKNGYFWLFSTASFFKILKFEASARWAVLRTASASLRPFATL